MAGGVVAEFFIALGLDLNAQSFVKGQVAVDLLKKGVRLLADAVRAVPSMALAAADYANNVTDMSQATGVGVVALQELAYAAKSADIDLAETGRILNDLSSSMVEAKDKTSASAKNFKAIGISVRDANGNLKSTDVVMGEIADAFQRMPDGAKKNKLAFDLLGRSGRQLIPVLNQGSAGLRSFAEAGRKTGNIQDASVIAKNNESAETIKKLGSAWSGLKMTIGTALLPALTDAAKAMAAWIVENREAIASGIKAFVDTLTAAFGALAAVVNAVAVATAFVIDNMAIFAPILGAIVLPLTLMLVKALAGLVLWYGYLAVAAIYSAGAAAIAWLAVAWPIVLIGAIVGGLIYVFIRFRTKIKEILKAVGRFFVELGQAFATFPAAVWAGLQAIGGFFSRVGSEIKSVWDAVIGALGDAWDAFFDPIKKAVQWAIDKANWVKNQVTGADGSGPVGAVRGMFDAKVGLGGDSQLSGQFDHLTKDPTTGKWVPKVTPPSVSLPPGATSSVTNGPSVQVAGSTYHITTGADPDELMRKLDERDASKLRTAKEALS